MGQHQDTDLVAVPRALLTDVIATLCGPDGNPRIVHDLRRHFALRTPSGPTLEAVELAAMERAIERMGWPEIEAYHAELRRGQDHREDAGGFVMRAIRRLFGMPAPRPTVETYQAAARAMIRKAA
ncbi:hypothetical protein [Methylobacterium iners]|uniref:Uncharacterized protein n=1 Tax=Methylobacterium iners TaxID=418707 RepID=A0ABQ4S6Y6_9HYPH|nr:hypothetical protein [Methylobacterium iners]GJD97440.1 hypothetical protein OCOJLMKI_4671 [Methylobacterium iners]